MQSVLFKAATVALLIGMSAPAADAQERRKSERSRSEERSSQSSPSVGGPPCIGTMFLLRDSESTSCRHPDGRRTCTVRLGTSGGAVFSDCK